MTLNDVKDFKAPVITANGFHLIIAAGLLTVGIVDIGMHAWTFYAPVSEKTFEAYKEGVKAEKEVLQNEKVALDARFARIENKIDAIFQSVNNPTMLLQKDRRR